MSRQDQAARTREAILDAAATVFDQFGYPNASLSMITEQAHVAKGALYFHFNSKEELARVIIDQQFQLTPTAAEYARGMQGLIDLTYAVAQAIVDEVRVRAAIRLVIEHASFTTPMSEPYLNWISIVRTFLERAKQDGHLIATAQPDAAAVLIVACFTGTQLVSEVLAGRKDIESRLTVMWQMLLPSLVQPHQGTRLRLPQPR